MENENGKTSVWYLVLIHKYGEDGWVLCVDERSGSKWWD